MTMRNYKLMAFTKSKWEYKVEICTNVRKSSTIYKIIFSKTARVDAEVILKAKFIEDI